MNQTLPMVYCVRQADTAWTLTGQHIGRTDLRLTERGERQARGIGASLGALRIERNLSRPLPRARRKMGALLSVVAAPAALLGSALLGVRRRSAEARRRAMWVRPHRRGGRSYGLVISKYPPADRERFLSSSATRLLAPLGADGGLVPRQIFARLVLEDGSAAAGQQGGQAGHSEADERSEWGLFRGGVQPRFSVAATKCDRGMAAQDLCRSPGMAGDTARVRRLVETIA